LYLVCLDAIFGRKSYVSSVLMQRERGCCGEQFDAGDACEDEGGTQEGAASEMLVKDEKGGQAGEDWFEGEEDRSVCRGEMLLGPALDGERGGSG